MSATEDSAQAICRAIERCGTLMYADKQALKAGDHRAVLDRLTTRYRIQIIVFYGFLANMVWINWHEDSGVADPNVVFWAATAIAGGVWFHHLWRQFAQARRLIHEHTSRNGAEPPPTTTERPRSP